MDVVEYLEDLEMVLFQFSDDLPENENITLSMDYTGTVQEDMAGFYRRYEIHGTEQNYSIPQSNLFGSFIHFH